MDQQPMPPEAYAAYGVAASYREAVRTVQPYTVRSYVRVRVPYMPYGQGVKAGPMQAINGLGR
jgi:hypothetical protein